MKKCAIRAEIALLLTNQIAGNAIDFKMNIIKLGIILVVSFHEIKHVICNKPLAIIWKPC